MICYYNYESMAEDYSTYTNQTTYTPCDYHYISVSNNDNFKRWFHKGCLGSYKYIDMDNINDIKHYYDCLTCNEAGTGLEDPI